MIHAAVIISDNVLENERRPLACHTRIVAHVVGVCGVSRVVSYLIFLG